MKKILMFFVLIAVNAYMLAQGEFTIGVVVPEQDELGDVFTYKMLLTKLEQQMSQTGVSSEGGNIVLYPIINIIKSDVVKGGIKDIHKVEVEMTLNVTEQNSKLLFGNEVWKLNGFGYSSQQEALRNAFSQMNPNDEKFAKFINLIKEKIKDYYINNRISIIKKAENLASLKQYEEAMALLYEYPQELQGANSIKDELLSIYIKYQKDVCGQLIQNAYGAIANQNYDSAIDYLIQIDYQSPCSNEALKLIKQINIKLEKERLQSIRIQEMQKQRAYNLEKFRITAIKSIVKSYYQRTWPNVTYETVVLR
jgi:hypothetical protein